MTFFAHGGISIKLFCGILSIFNFDPAHQSWISGVLKVAFIQKVWFWICCLLLLVGNLHFKFRIVIWNVFFLRFEKHISLSEKKPPLGVKLYVPGWPVSCDLQTQLYINLDLTRFLLFSFEWSLWITNKLELT